jgi:hypothetical protein
MYEYVGHIDIIHKVLHVHFLMRDISYFSQLPAFTKFHHLARAGHLLALFKNICFTCAVIKLLVSVQLDITVYYVMYIFGNNAKYLFREILTLPALLCSARL